MEARREDHEDVWNMRREGMEKESFVQQIRSIGISADEAMKTFGICAEDGKRIIVRYLRN